MTNTKALHHIRALREPWRATKLGAKYWYYTDRAMQAGPRQGDVLRTISLHKRLLTGCRIGCDLSYLPIHLSRDNYV